MLMRTRPIRSNDLRYHLAKLKNPRSSAYHPVVQFDPYSDKQAHIHLCYLLYMEGQHHEKKLQLYA